MNWSYVAGFFDGEGCISSSFSKSRLPRVGITITQKDPHILELISNFLGFGQVGLDKKSWGDCGILRITGASDQRKFLQGILPYVIGKKSQVDLALRLIDLNGGQGRKVSAEVRADRERLAQLLSEAKSGMI